MTDTSAITREQNEQPRPNRRHFFMACGAAFIFTASASACDALTTEPETNERDDAGGESADKGKEAPMLADLVKSGDLPAVEERLPDVPLEVAPNDRIGVYGGDWRNSFLGPSDDAWLGRTVGYENLMRWDPQFEGVIPNVAEEITEEDDGRAYVVKLRAGMKWSDGQPFTADDLVFAYDEVMMNTDLYPVPPPIFVIDQKPGRIEKVDDTTVRFVFDAPKSLFIEDLATPYSSDFMGLPRHYMEQFHEKFNPNIQELVEEADQPDWIELFFLRAEMWENPELPRLHPWVVTQPISEASRAIFERNPYYWKVDPDGSQLPYLDRFVATVVSDPEVMVLSASNGEIDMQDRTINTLQNKPVLAKAREEGGFDFFDEVPSDSNACVIALNLTSQDPVKREIFLNRDFRVALSMAINRQEIIDTVFQRQGEPAQVAPTQTSEFYDEEMTKQYTEYDPDAANQLLDSAGFSERDGDGLRLGPNGEPIRFAIDVPIAYRPEWIDVTQRVREHWLEIGIDAQVKTEERSLFDERTDSGQHDVAVWQAEGGGWIEPLMRTDWYFPSQNESQNYARAWMLWYQTFGADGEEPPAEVREQMELYGQMRQTTDVEARNELMRQVLQISKEFFYHIGTVLPPESYGVVRNNFHNVPASFPQSFLYPTPGPTNAEQYFISDE